MQIFTHAHRYSKKNLLIAAVVAASTLFTQSSYAGWNIDLSRRQKEMRQADMNEGQEVESTTTSRSPASAQPMFAESPQPTSAKWVDSKLPDPAPNPNFESGDQANEVVILNTGKGFVPSTVRLRKDVKYKIHVVNVNDKEKNISFVLDGFSEHQATYYGKVKSFYLQPTREGVYSFQCPETSIEGRLVVFAPPGATNIRVPASAGAK